MSAPLVVAVDGPAASGKTTVSVRLAERLGALALDTGILYRGLAWLALKHGVAADDGPSLAALTSELGLEAQAVPGSRARLARLLVDGQDITDTLYTTEVE